MVTVETPDGEHVDCITHGKGKGAVVGDDVYFSLDADTDLGDGVVRSFGERRSELCRTDSLGRRKQVLAANVDCVYVVCAPEPPLRTGLIDRYLVALSLAGIPARIVFNKIDLLDDETLLEALETLATYPRIGYPLHLVSAIDGRGLEALGESLAESTSIFVGHSGVGKTSLLNALDPGLGERVAELSGSSGRGTHTTTASAMFKIPGGGEVIDSPGVRAFRLWGIEPHEVREHFAEFADYAPECRFANCQHMAEPACAVKAALEEGDIDPSRYDAYLRIRDSLDLDFAWRG